MDACMHAFKFKCCSVLISIILMRSIAKEFLNLAANHYPERLGCFIVVDAPRIFSMMWAAIRPIVDVKTKEKIVFLPWVHCHPHIAPTNEQLAIFSFPQEMYSSISAWHADEFSATPGTIARTRVNLTKICRSRTLVQSWGSGCLWRCVIIENEDNVRRYVPVIYQIKYLWIVWLTTSQ